MINYGILVRTMIYHDTRLGEVLGLDKTTFSILFAYWQPPRAEAGYASMCGNHSYDK